MNEKKPRKLMVEVTGVIDAPAEKTWPLLRDSLAPKEVYGMTAAYQGGWWYRGEWTAEPDGERTRVTHRVYNVAQWMRWGVPLANRFFIGFTAHTRNGFEEAITEIARQLGTTARLAPSGPARGTVIR
ncbi:hypothetical protein [Acrocarpospora sp. B8E8]|uniref:hypothetical protein n=1 Tax=Acrocarpospora sp. B8E8 TaxID=3153572 RepID=UPI00325DBE09